MAPGLIGSIESPKFPHKYTLSQIYKICHYFNITIEQLFISEEDFSKDRDIIDIILRILATDGNLAAISLLATLV